MWSAVRALEDSASSARWRLTQPSPPANCDAIIERAEQEAELIRGLLQNREGDTSDSESRPSRW